ncbi:MAG: DsrE family protein [Chloroflexi bacterium]|nr:DsrE family protein [Chloroflexota bacterium]
MTKQSEKLALVIDSASYERVTFALGLATAAAAIGQDVRVIFGHGGVVRLKKGLTDGVGEETDSWVRERVRAAIEKGSISPVSELLSVLKKVGGKVYACPAAMDLHGITVEELVAEVDEVRSVVRFVQEDAKDASFVYV